MRTLSILAVTATLALAACASTREPAAEAAPPPITPTERYGIQVNPRPEELRLKVYPNGISPNQVTALSTYARDYMANEGGDITVQVPAGGQRTADAARQVLISQGVAPSKLHFVGVGGAPDPSAPISIVYTRYQAQGPRCGERWENLTATRENREYDNFGCAMTANVAAQIDNAGDLLAPRPSDPADAGRRSTVLGHYRAGEVTSSARDSQASGAVSRAVD